MAQFVSADDRNGSCFHGLESIFEYTNDDGQLPGTNCGQAASATFLTHHGQLPADPEQATGIMAAIERTHPPDQFFGWFGTGRGQVEAICRAQGRPVTALRGEKRLREQIALGNPVILMAGVSGGKLFNRFDLPGGHWMVAYGFDEEHIFLSNWGTMTWEEFHQGWVALVPSLIKMRLTGLAFLG